MSRREAWASAALVFLVAVAVRLWASSIITFPRPEDTAYYVGVARNLVEGRGLVSDAIWSYGTPPLSFPRPAFEVWLPLPTFLAALPMAIFGTAFAVAQWPSMLLGGLVAVLAWRLAADVATERGLPLARARTLALGMGLSSAVFLPLVLHSVLPDSTMLFGALVLSTCLLGTGVLRDPRGGRASDPRVLAIGVLLGLAALTRNEAIWLALTWVWMVARADGLERSQRVALVAGAAIPAMVVFAPWAIRDWIAFGSPFPGQALANALSLRGTDVFAWGETPTLSSYLGSGIAHLIGLRITAFFHNLVNVLLLLGIPISAIGLIALPWTATGRAFGLPRPTDAPEGSGEPVGPPPAYVAAPMRAPGAPVTVPLAGPSTGASLEDRPAPTSSYPAATTAPGDAIPWVHQADRPLAYAAKPERTGATAIGSSESRPGPLAMLIRFSVVTFVATTLLFPVATTWGTFLHASAAVQVLLLLSALVALDRLIAEVGRRREWARPVAWLGPTLGIAAGALFTLALLPSFGRDGEGTRARFEALPAALAAAGVPFEVRGAPVITDFPIYLAEITGAHALALPDEPPASVLDLAAHFPGAQLVIVSEAGEGLWPDVALSDPVGLECFEFVPIELEGVRVYRITCQ